MGVFDVVDVVEVIDAILVVETLTEAEDDALVVLGRLVVRTLEVVLVVVGLVEVEVVVVVMGRPKDWVLVRRHKKSWCHDGLSIGSANRMESDSTNGAFTAV